MNYLNTKQVTASDAVTAVEFSTDVMTNSMGAPISNDQNSLTVGQNGPVLLEDVTLIEKMAHFDRERVPERVVHAKGTGAFGSFSLYQSMCAYTYADFLQTPGQTTPVFVRFSTVIGSKDSADTARDPRGFATKFYTRQGNYDLVGNNIPVFFIRDAIQFPDLIHSLKKSPDTNLKVPERFWDFISFIPESTHMISWVYSDRGTIKNYAKMDGFGVNTYVWVNSGGSHFYVKYHWKTLQGIETITRQEAETLAGCEPDIAIQHLHEDIAGGRYPQYELCVQIMDPSDAQTLDFDPLDDTKTWSETDYPLIRVGLMTLNRNPANFFAEVEQSAFCPANVVPGITFSADKMLQGRSFSYSDTQRHRIGPNFAQLPINHSAVPVHNHQQDGNMDFYYTQNAVNYSPNSLDQNQPVPASLPVPKPDEICGKAVRAVISKEDDFKQAGLRYNAMFQAEKEHLADNMAVELATCRDDIVNRVLCNINQASRDWGFRVLTLIHQYRSV